MCLKSATRRTRRRFMWYDVHYFYPFVQKLNETNFLSLNSQPIKF